MASAQLPAGPGRAARWVLAFCVAAAACSGGDSLTRRGSGDPTPPSIVNLSTWPPSVVQNQGGGSESVSFSLQIADAGADLSKLVVAIRDGGGAEVDRFEGGITNPPGQQSSQLNGSVPVPTAALTTLTLEFQVFDAGGSGSNVRTGTVTIVPGNPQPAIASISPTRAPAGAGPITLTVTGSGFVASSYVTWNGSFVGTTYVNETTLTAVIPAYSLSWSGTAQVAVYTPPPGGGMSAASTFTIDPQPPSPAPTLSSISPSTVEAGTASVKLTARGTGFVPSSCITWTYGNCHATTYVDDTTLETTLGGWELSSVQTVQVGVSTPAPGGGTSSTLPFAITRPPISGVTWVSLKANDAVWDPWQRRLYLSVPSASPTNPNTVTVLDPFTGALTGSTFAGSEPGRLALSDDGTLLYVGLGGAASVHRFTVPAFALDLDIPLGLDSTWGPLYARDVQAAPGAPGTVAVSSGAPGGYAYASEVTVYDDATARAKKLSSTSTFDSLQWGAAASTLYARSSNSLLATAADATGVVVSGTFSGAFGAYYSYGRMYRDAGTGLLYSDEGYAVNPANGLPDGTYPLPGVSQTVVAPDSSLDAAFFAGIGSSSGLELHAFDLVRYFETRVLRMPYVPGPARRVVRFGSDGVAILTDTEVVLVRGAAVLPVSATDNPLPAVTALSPSSAASGGGNFRLVVTGTGFVPGSVVQWNGSGRSTTYASATQLVAYVPASDLSAAGSAAVTVVSPLPGGGTSGAATFTVN